MWKPSDLAWLDWIFNHLNLLLYLITEISGYCKVQRAPKGLLFYHREHIIPDHGQSHGSSSDPQRLGPARPLSLKSSLLVILYLNLWTTETQWELGQLCIWLCKIVTMQTDHSFKVLFVHAIQNLSLGGVTMVFQTLIHQHTFPRG